MIVVTAFTPEHLAALRLQGSQASAQPLMTLEHGQQIASAGGYARTALLDGEPIACAGIMEKRTNCGYAWAYLGARTAGHWKTLHRAVLNVVQAGRWRRVEMAVDVRDPMAKRWAAHLGFVYEGTHRAWTHDGRDVETWARVTACKQ